MRKEDTLARLGGDEFAILIEHLHQAPESAVNTAREFCQLLNEPFTLTDRITVHVGGSFGVALYPTHVSGQTDESEALIQAADRAMYRAKKEGRNRVVIAAG